MNTLMKLIVRLVLILVIALHVLPVIKRLDLLIRPISEGIIAREQRLQKDGVTPAPTPFPIPPNESEVDKHVREALTALHRH
jgi:hypothetical protein